jgi:hypothetical protein
MVATGRESTSTKTKGVRDISDFQSIRTPFEWQLSGNYVNDLNWPIARIRHLSRKRTFARLFPNRPELTLNLRGVWPKPHRLTVLSVLTAAGGNINSHLLQPPSTFARSFTNEALGTCNNEANKNYHEGK